MDNLNKLGRDDIFSKLLLGGYSVTLDSPILDLIVSYPTLPLKKFLSQLGVKSSVNSKKGSSEVPVFWLEGFSTSFYSALKGFSRYIYNKGLIGGYFDDFYEEAKDRVEDRLLNNMYDPTKANFKSYIYSLLRHAASSYRYRLGKTFFIEGLSDSAIGSITLEGAGFLLVDSRESFFQYCSCRGVSINRERFFDALLREEASPLVLLYLWLLHRKVI